jgi:hypothetical protein
MAKFSQNQIWPGTPDNVRWPKLVKRQLVALGKREMRHGYNSPYCPVVHRIVRWCTVLSGEPTVPAANRRSRDQRATRGPRQRSVGHTGLSGAPTDPEDQRSAGPRMEGNRAPDCYSGCPVHDSTEGKNCLPN